MVHPGGCIAGDPSTAPAMFPLNPGEVSQYLTPVASGKLGLNGASVNLYSVKTDEGKNSERCIAFLVSAINKASNRFRF